MHEPLTAWQIFEAVVGSVVVLIILFDVFTSVVVPRPVRSGLRISAYLLRGTWRTWRRIGLRLDPPQRRDAFLGVFASLAVVLLLIVWEGGLILGFGLFFHGLRHDVRPQLHNYGQALYFAAT